jgi:hypothetical protein
MIATMVLICVAEIELACCRSCTVASYCDAFSANAPLLVSTHASKVPKTDAGAIADRGRPPGRASEQCNELMIGKIVHS